MKKILNLLYIKLINLPKNKNLIFQGYQWSAQSRKWDHNYSDQGMNMDKQFLFNLIIEKTWINQFTCFKE